MASTATSTGHRSPPTRKSAYIKATENTHYQNGYVTQRYDGAYNAGLVRGAHHFAIPTGRPSRATSDAGTLPAGWTFWTSWQFADSDTFPCHQDLVSGHESRLLALADDIPRPFGADVRIQCHIRAL